MKSGLGVLLAGLLSLSGTGRAIGPQVPAAEREAARDITPERLRAHIRFLASDLLEGRGPTTRGDRFAEAYLQSQLEALGLAPGAPEGGFIQKVPLVGIRPASAAGAVFRSDRGVTQGVPGESFVGSSGVQLPEAKVEDAEIVFVGYGIQAPEYRWDDFKSADLAGKVLLIMNNDPEGSASEPDLFAGKTRLRYGRWDYKYAMAGSKGAAGAIIIHTTPSAGYPWQVVKSSWSGELFELPDDGKPRVQVKGWATEELARSIAALGGKDLDQLRSAAQDRSFRPVPLGVKMSFALHNEISRKESGNVIAVLRGSDPVRAKEAVLYTAHHDHLGLKPGPKPGEELIYHGALDNASGVAAVLSVARAFASLPAKPARSIVFAFVAGEEQGLLGSQWLAAHPPFPAGRIAADINVDMIGWFGKTRDLTMIGLGKSSLDADVEALAAMQGRTVKPDAFPDRGAFYRSDQYSLAQVGIPAAYLGGGNDVIGKPEGFGRQERERFEKSDYHQPSDAFREDWDLSGAVEDVQLDFYLGCRLANAKGMPVWKSGDEFEPARRKALAEAAKDAGALNPPVR